MNVKRAPNTKTIVILGVGAAFALGLAIYAIVSTISGGSGASNTVAKLNPGTSTQASAVATGPGSEHANESVMAIHADPFAPLSINPQSSAAADTRAGMDPNAGTSLPMPSGNVASHALGANGQAATPGGGYPVGPQVQPSNAGSPVGTGFPGQARTVPGSNGGVMQTRPIPGFPGQPAPAGGQAGPSGSPGQQQKNPFGQSAAAAPPAPKIIVQGSTIRGPAPKVNGWIQTSAEQPAARPTGQGSSRVARGSHAIALGNPGGSANPFATAGDNPPAESRGGVMPMEVEQPSPEPPALMGTLLGERPSAVFKAQKGMRIIEIGESISGWKLLRVAHGRAVMKMAGRQVSLGLTGKGAAGMIVKAGDGYFGPFSHKVRHYLPQQTSEADADTNWIYSSEGEASADAANPFETASSSRPAQRQDSERSPLGEASKQPIPVALPQSEADKPKPEADPKTTPNQPAAADPPAVPGKG